QFRQSVDFIVCPAIFDRHIAALDIAGFAETFMECHHPTRFRRTTSEISDHRHRALLRPRRERPRRRAADERDEVAPFHSAISSPRTPSDGGTGRGIAFAAPRLMPTAGPSAPTGR